MDIIRVLRVIEYTGPRDEVEEQVANSIHGERRVRGMVIKVATIGAYPEVLGQIDPCRLLPGQLPLHEYVCSECGTAFTSTSRNCRDGDCSVIGCPGTLIKIKEQEDAADSQTEQQAGPRKDAYRRT